MRKNATLKTGYSDVSTGTSDSHFDFLPAIFMRRRLTSGPNLRKPVVNANSKPRMKITDYNVDRLAMGVHISLVLFFRSKKKDLDYPKDLYENALCLGIIAYCGYQY